MLKYFFNQFKILKILLSYFCENNPSLCKFIFIPLFILTLSFTITLQSCDILDSEDKYEPPTIEINYPPIDQYPAWSPDGNKIIYYHLGITKINSDGAYIINSDSAGLWIINSDGTNPRLLLQGINIYADWSPNGDWIVFEQGGQIYKAPFISDSIDKARITQLTFDGRNFFPSWSPDGQWIAYDRSITNGSEQAGVWIMKSDGSGKQHLKGGAFPNWHPSSRNLVFSIGATPTSTWKRFVIYYPFDITPAETLDVLINQDNLFPKYSPNGNQIIFQSQADGEIPQIWLINADGSTPLRISNDGGEMPDWSPSSKIVFVKYNYRKWQGIDISNGTLWIMNPDGSNKQQLTFGP